MNLTQMLFQNVKPLFDQPVSKVRECSNPSNQKKREHSRQRLEAALPPGKWLPGPEIARRLGTTIESVNKTLQMFRARGEIESRPINPGKGRNLEWRWAE